MLALLMLLSSALCCTVLPDGTFACLDKQHEGAAAMCSWQVTCEWPANSPIPRCFELETFAGVDLRCCDDQDVLDGMPMSGCRPAGTALGVLPWCHDPDLDALAGCPAGWADGGSNGWICDG